MQADLEGHIEDVVSALRAGELIPFLGAGANLCDRVVGAAWQPDCSDLLPQGGELASFLASRYRYPEDPAELARVAQYAAVKRGSGPLYTTLLEVFDRDFPLTSLHRLLAQLPGQLRARGYPSRQDEHRRRFVAVTTNYDDLLERAFAAQGEPCHVVWYKAAGRHEGCFLHRPPGGEARVVSTPSEYPDLLHDELPILLKIHGTVDRGGDLHSFVITEDDYIQFLARSIGASALPTPLPLILKERHLLFLGYSLRDWNLRVILNRIWDEQEHSWQFWSIQLKADAVEREFWHHRGVEILDLSMADYVTALSAAVEALPRRGVAT